MAESNRILKVLSDVYCDCVRTARAAAVEENMKVGKRGTAVGRHEVTMAWTKDRGAAIAQAMPHLPMSVWMRRVGRGCTDKQEASGQGGRGIRMLGTCGNDEAGRLVRGVTEGGVGRVGGGVGSD